MSTTTVPADTPVYRDLPEPPEDIVTDPGSLVDLLLQTAERYGLRADRRDSTRPAALYVARMLQQIIRPADGGVQ